MPEGMMPQPSGAPPAGGAPPMPPGGQASGPGMVQGPVANAGLMAAAKSKLAVVAQALQTVLVALPAGSDEARDVREALNKLAKHVAPMDASPGVQMTEAQRALMQQRQMGPQIAQMRAQGGGAPPAAPPPQPQAA